MMDFVSTKKNLLTEKQADLANIFLVNFSKNLIYLRHLFILPFLFLSSSVSIFMTKIKVQTIT